MATSLPSSAKAMADRGISVAQLLTISLARLNAKDPVELASLKKAASCTGFFHLDFRGDTRGERVLEHLPGVYEAVENYFNQPEEVKVKGIRKDIKASQDLGWKKGNGGESFEVTTKDQ
jgi:hypothetical protein